MRILFTRFPYASAHGGAEIQTISLLRGLQKRGHNIAFLGSCPTLLAMCQQFHIRTEEVHIGKPPVSKWSILHFFWQKKAMQAKLLLAFQKFQAHGVEVLCMLSLTEKILLTPYAVQAGIKVVWIEHDSVGRWLTWNPFLRTLLRLSQSVTTVVVSELSRKKYIQIGWQPQHVVSIPNGIDVSRFLEEPTEKEVEDTTQVHIGTVARLDYEKGIDVLLQSIEKLPNVQLTIVGAGKQQKQLEAQIATLGLQDRVAIVSHVGALHTFYNTLDIFVLPSRTHDPFGLVAAEAMCTGTPVVVTDACGIAYELAHKKNALIAKAGSVASLQTAITMLVENKNMRKVLGLAGQQKALANFTVESMVEKYETLLEQ